MIIIKNKLTKNKQEVKLIYDGNFSNLDFFAPSYVNFENPKYVEINDKYCSGILIVNFSREQEELILRNLIETNIDMNISMFYEKLDNHKIIQELTYHIGSLGVDIKSTNQNRQDIDVVNFTYNDAKYIRKEMQINNEDFYYLYIYLNIFFKDLKEKEYLENKIEGICESVGLQIRKANFRQEQTLISTLPIMNNHTDVKEVTKRNILTSGLVATYPFISSTIFDEKGVFVGVNKYNDSLVFIDRFNKEKYKNANMCIFGTSGAGKSYFTKLQILRNKLFNITQYIIDPEREYEKICNSLEGSLVKIGEKYQNHINIFDIREESLVCGEKGYLSIKINKLMEFFNLVFEELSKEEEALLEQEIIKCYELKGILFDDNSLYEKQENNEQKFIQTNKMPKMEDLYKLLENNKKLNNLKTKLYPFVYGHLKFFNNYTNIEFKNTLIIADIYDLGKENIKYGLYLITEILLDKIKKSRDEPKIIYFDEIWKLIGANSNKNTAKFIYEIFKTIRKYNGSAVAITQDIDDLFSLEERNLWKKHIK